MDGEGMTSAVHTRVATHNVTIWTRTRRQKATVFGDECFSQGFAARIQICVCM